MPELPEVETVRRGLEEAIVGKLVCGVEVTGRRSVRRQSPAELVAALVGRRLVSTGRIGKFLLVGLDDGATLVMHLRMSGQLRVHTDPSDERAPHTHVVISFGDESELRFVDPRTFGELFVSTSSGGEGRPAELATIGIDALDERLDAALVRALIGRRRVALKAFLLDQGAIAGIGSIYADEIAFRSHLRPTRPVGTLSRRDVDRLVEALGAVLDDAVELGGSTLRDARYRDVLGESGRFQDRHAVYGRTGLACVACGAPVRVTRVAGRSAHYCASCQR